MSQRVLLFSKVPKGMSIYVCGLMFPTDHTDLSLVLPDCTQAYWPFHRDQCYRNEFADLVENQEPKFARWMRKHRKMAVLKDDEVDRLEQASQSTTGYNREEVMASMYNRLAPKPRGTDNLCITLCDRPDRVHTTCSLLICVLCCSS